MDNVEKVAKGLSEAQREAMLDGLGDAEHIPMFTTPACRCALQRKGLVRNRQYEERLTPLGQSVRQYLQEQANG